MLTVALDKVPCLLLELLLVFYVTAQVKASEDYHGNFILMSAGPLRVQPSMSSKDRQTSPHDTIQNIFYSVHVYTLGVLSFKVFKICCLVICRIHTNPVKSPQTHGSFGRGLGGVIIRPKLQLAGR